MSRREAVDTFTRSFPLRAIVAVMLGWGSAPACAQTTCEGCGTEVPGGSVVGETWTAAESPYCVTGDLFISNLTIEPGVCVLVDGPYRLNIQTTIHAEGTEDQPIIFTAKDPDTSKWRGMEFDQTVPGSVLRHCVFSYADDSAMRLLDSTLTIDRCRFIDNAAPDHGGAVLSEGPDADLTLLECRFEGNRTEPPPDFGNTYGGAVYAEGDLVVDRCAFDSNTARGWPAPGKYRGGHGGAIAFGGGESGRRLTVTGSLFTNNRADAPNGGGHTGRRYARGGAIFIGSGEDIVISNTVIGGNTLGGSHELGGGVLVRSGTVSLVNVACARNDRAGLHIEDGTVAVRNSIFRENNGGSDQIIGDACVDYSCVQNGFAGDCGDNNIAYNPAFAGSGTTLCDLTILDGSPCIDAGDPSPDFNDSAACDGPPYGTERNDMGAHGGPGACWTVPPSLCCPSPANLNCDCSVDSQDFIMYLNRWAAGDPRADTNDDGTIDTRDFILYLNTWVSGC